MSDLLIKDIDTVLTVDPDDTVLEDVSIVVQGNEIAEIGSASEIAEDYPETDFDEVVDGNDMLLMPGLVDSHFHLSEHLSRGLFPDNLATRPWVFNWAKPYYSSVDEEAEVWSVRMAILEMIKTGTTCFLDMGSQNNTELIVETAAETGMRGVTGRHAADVKPDTIPPYWSEEMVDHHFFDTADDALEALEESVEKWNNYADDRIRCWANIEGKEPCSPELHRGASELAEELGVGTTYHVSSSIEEVEGSEEKYGMWPIERLNEIDALGPNVVLAHAVAIKDREIEMLAEHDTKVAFCPGTTFKLAKGAANIGKYPEMLDAGITVSLGCDGNSAAGSADMHKQMWTVAGLFKDARMDPDMIPASKAIRMATIDGAEALLWDDEIGSVEVGKRADFIMFDTNEIEWTPHHRPIQTTVYSANSHNVKHSIIDGDVVMKDRDVLTMDEEEIKEQARIHAERTAEKSGLVDGAIPTTTTLYD
ncbi:amidohydrolase family protein [Natrarchaeobius chitinivorans]|uniref:Amidohydrolase n=1 Tax=Natrarchaeobius chitinivorans TaxID=1679083 RepID=A0A3N6N8Q2_NATCH|nr:amidohydrolase [Natrarchaeobius chitinivorans]RQG94852.1 amidohydrolase [Natrarchaeobius chitinivorans]